MFEMVSSVEFQCFSEIEFGRCACGRNSTRMRFSCSALHIRGTWSQLTVLLKFTSVVRSLLSAGFLTVKFCWHLMDVIGEEILWDSTSLFPPHRLTTVVSSHCCYTTISLSLLTGALQPKEHLHSLVGFHVSVQSYKEIFAHRYWPFWPHPSKHHCVSRGSVQWVRTAWHGVPGGEPEENCTVKGL